MMVGSSQLAASLAAVAATLVHISSASQLSQATESRNDFTVFSHNKKVTVAKNFPSLTETGENRSGNLKA
jgi:hypothetical protein